MKNSAQTGHRGAALVALAVFLILACTGLLIVSYFFGYVIPPGQMGLRQVTFGPSQGFGQEALAPGYHWSIPMYTKIHFIPETVQVISLQREEGDTSRVAPSLEVQTKDGSSVDVDITVLARYLNGRTEEHGGPADLIQNFGLEPERWITNIVTVASNELKKSLGRLSTSEFYDPNKRELQVQRAFKGMNERLLPNGVRVEAVLLRRYTYVEARIDDAIFLKNLQDQEERLNEALSLKAEAKAELEQVSAEWDAKIKTLRVQGENIGTVIRSEADLYETQKVAEGDLLVARAHAEVDRLKAGALANAQGAEIYVGRELAPLLSSLKGGVVTQIDPYDLNEWMKKLGVGGEVR